MAELRIRDFNITEASWSQQGSILSNLRKIVFIVEQNVPQEEEWDGLDEDSWHWLACDEKEQPIGTSRLLPDGQIGRMAVLKEFRGKGVGAALLERAVEKARHLGMSQVFLNAQTHAEVFYRKAGFIPEGEEFMEAGIPHQRMTQQIELPTDANQRYLNQNETLTADIKQFDVAEIDWRLDQRAITRLRKSILFIELGNSETTLTDEVDDDANHWVARDNEDELVGAIRMTVDGQISYLIVAANWRRLGVGTSLIEAALSKARRYGLAEVEIEVEPSLETLVSRIGFTSDGDTRFTMPLESEDVHGVLRKTASNNLKTARYGASLDEDSESENILGETNKVFLLRREEEFRNVTLQLAQQAGHTIRIYSPVLDHRLYDHEELREALSALARRNKYTDVKILLFDSHRVVKNGHALLSLSRRLPSSVNMRIVHPDYRQLNHEYVVADGIGLVYRIDYENYEGFANFKELSDAGKYTRQFNSAWESSLSDPNLRRLFV